FSGRPNFSLLLTNATVRNPVLRLITSAESGARIVSSHAHPMTLPAFLLCAAISANAAVTGVVRDAKTGEPLSKVLVALADPPRKLITGAHGEFDFGSLPPGDYSLKLATVGYRMLQFRFHLDDGESKELQVVLSPDSAQPTDRVEVRADPFDLEGRREPTAFTIDGSETKNLAGVLADDPLRAVQSLPGVTSNDDFDSRFSIHGAPYERVGLYLDGILLHTPFHTVQGEGPTGSLTVFNGDMV